MTYTATVKYLTVLNGLETDYLSGLDDIKIYLEDDIYYIGDLAVARGNFISARFYDDDEDVAEDETDNSTDRVREIADLVLEELTKSGKVKTYATGGVLPEPKPFGGSGITTNPNPIQPWNTPDTFEAPRPVWVSDTVDAVLRQEPKTSLERAVEERRRGTY